ncbi:transcription factor SPT20 homolog [Rhagoletis pomonella]|uniref:transcription factor SPT20 homolog n=1 Tax=Rhagoletis pomonella TaxID=28610 RepID=UPI00178635D9|nr:transcription factor SPT20 homolog [Rhagoletis pomonella]
MKLTICQIGKLFLLLTAFYLLLLDSPQLLGVHCTLASSESTTQRVANVKRGALDAATAGELTTTSAKITATTTATTKTKQITTAINASAVRAVIVDNNNNNNNNNSKKNNSASDCKVEAGVKAEQLSEVRVQQIIISKVNITENKPKIKETTQTTVGKQIGQVTTAQRTTGAATSTSPLGSTALEHDFTKIEGVQKLQKESKINHKAYRTTTVEVEKSTEIGKPLTLAVAVAATAASTAEIRRGKDGQLSTVGQHVAETAKDRPQRQQHLLAKQKQQQGQLQTLPDNQQQSQQQQVQQQQHQKVTARRPTEQVGTKLRPTIARQTTTPSTYSTAMSAKTTTGIHSSSQTSKIKKFPTKVSKQQQQQQHQKYQQNPANGKTQPKDNRNQSKQKRREAQLRQQQRQQRANGVEKQQLFNQKQLLTQQQQLKEAAELHLVAREQLQQDAQHVPQQQPQQNQQQSQPRPAHATRGRQHVGVLIPSRILDVLQVQQGFHNFLDFFHVNLQNVSVDFIRDDDLSGFIKLLEHPKYTTVVKTLNAGINFAVEERSSSVKTASVNGAPAAKAKQQSQRQSQQQFVPATQINNATAALTETAGKMKKSSTSSNAPLVAYCHLAEQLSRDFNKTVLVWPCPRMKPQIKNSLKPRLVSQSWKRSFTVLTELMVLI